MLPERTVRVRPSPPGRETTIDAERRLESIARALAAFTPLEHAGTDRGVGSAPPPALASVALLVRPEPTDLEVLLIRRAVAEGDPWSGHMALPGGRRSPRDRHGEDAAARETREEVGIDVRERGLRIGRLDDVQPGPGAPRIVVSPYVFAVPPGTRATPNYEVDLAVWVPLERLAEPGAATHYLHALASGESLRFPAIGYQEHVIWGLTFRILSQFLEIARGPGAGGSQ